MRYKGTLHKMYCYRRRRRRERKKRHFIHPSRIETHIKVLRFMKQQNSRRANVILCVPNITFSFCYCWVRRTEKFSNLMKSLSLLFGKYKYPFKFQWWNKSSGNVKKRRREMSFMGKCLNSNIFQLEWNHWVCNLLQE